MKKHSAILMMLFCAFAIPAGAQNNLFSRWYDDYDAWEIFLQAIELNDSTILLSGTTQDLLATDSTQNDRLYFSILNSRGEKIRSNILSYTNQKFIYTEPFIKKGNEIFTIASYENLDTLLKGQGRYAKGIYMSSSGDTSRTFKIAFHYLPNGKQGFGSPHLLKNGNFVTSASYNNTVGDSIYLFWSDSNGNIVRIKEYPQLHISISNIIETPDKGLLLIGSQTYEEYYVLTPDSGLVFRGHPERLWYAKTDSIGNFLWQRLLTGPRYELYDTIWFKYRLFNRTRYKDAISTTDGNYLLTGYIENNPYLAKINENGQILWDYTYFKHLNYLDSLRRNASFVDILEKDGNLFIFGRKDSLLPGQQSVQTIPFLMKLTEAGKTIWTRYFISGVDDILYKVFESGEGFILTGSKMDSIQKYGRQDAWLLKVDSNGCLIQGCDLIDGIIPITFPQNKSFLIYPNPTSSTLKIESAQHYSSIELWNTTGGLVFKETHPLGLIDVSALPHGLYIIRILGAQQEVIATQKVSVVH